jgi:iron complex outermembrane receptor protein
MRTSEQLRLAVRATLAAAVAATATNAAHAQDQDQSASDIETVVVTGSRIARPDLQSNSPISIVTEEFFQQKGSVNVEEVLNQLPQVVPGLTAQVNNGGDGTATVDLRGLGPTRTLVLINGRRFVPATNTGRTDLNAIPANLIERIDVVTGGASAVYGSDALSGVVNFVLKDDYEGAEVGSRFGQSERGDGNTFDVHALLGGNFAEERGNATLAMTYYKRDPVFQDAREHSAIDLQGNGSATGVAGRLDNSPFNPYGAFGGAPAGSNYAFNADGTPRRFVNALPETNGGVGDRYNFSPINYLQTPQKRYTLDAFLKYDLAESVQAYAELYYIKNDAEANLAPTPATNLVLPVTNPLLTQETLDLLATRDDPTAPAIFRRRMVEFGERIADASFDTSQAVLGLNGKFSDSWGWDIFYSYGRTGESINIIGDISETRLNASLAGCPTGAGTVPNCRVVDFFGPNKITAEDVQFLRIPSAVDTFEFERQNVQGTVNGTLFAMPAGDVGAAFGVEYRKDSSSFIPSESSQRGDLSGFNALSPIAGSFDVKEVYAEFSIPLLADKPGVKSLSIETAGRYSDYSSVGGLSTYKGGLQYKPISSVTLRSTIASASRAPSVFELFQAGDQSFPTVTDPCALLDATGAENYEGNVVPAAIATVCQLSGLPGDGTYAAQANSQVEASLVGSSSLAEESSDTFTVGLVWTPEFISNFSVTLDYYDISVDGFVARLAGGAVAQVENCYLSGVTTAAEYAANENCVNISRNPSGELLITQPLVNTGTLTTKGIDVSLQYAFDLPSDLGNMSLRLDANMLDEFNLDGEEYSGLSSGDFGTLPELRSNLRVVYDRGPFQASLNWQRIGDVDERPGDGGDTHISAWNYFDLFSRFTIAERYTLSAGVSNLLDEDPPVILTGFTNTNTDNTTYDGIGRRYFVGLKIGF